MKGDRLEENLARLITSGSKFPVKRFYNTQAILLKEEAIRLRPTFHLRLTFMSSTQFYHRECNAYLSADAILPCYHLNRAGLIIISPRANMLQHKNLQLAVTNVNLCVCVFSVLLFPRRTLLINDLTVGQLYTGH